MTQLEIKKALEQYEQELRAMPDKALIGDDRELTIEWWLIDYEAGLEDVSDDELFYLENIREITIKELLKERAKELESQE